MSYPHAARSEWCQARSGPRLWFHIELSAMAGFDGLSTVQVMACAAFETKTQCLVNGIGHGWAPEPEPHLAPACLSNLLDEAGPDEPQPWLLGLGLLDPAPLGRTLIDPQLKTDGFQYKQTQHFSINKKTTFATRLPWVPFPGGRVALFVCLFACVFVCLFDLVVDLARTWKSGIISTWR